MRNRLQHPSPGWAERANDCAGQALLEFVFVCVMMLALSFGLIDFGRAIYQRQVLTALTRDGSNLASRGTTLTNTVDAVISSANPLDITTKGRVIVTAVFNSNGVYTISGQLSKGGLGATSKIGVGTGNPANMPDTTLPIPPLNQTVYVTEVFYSYTPITPIGKLLQMALPTNLYDVAYF
jgi:Flp pilus assembly protein TadG